MGNGQFQVPQHISKQWTQTVKNGKKFLRNKITLEEFEFMVLQKLQESQDISLLIERSIYSIPKTPKIIILNDQKGELFILVQQYDLYLAQHLPKLSILTDILQLLSQAFIVFHSLQKKYGCFGISENMIGLNRNMQILAWINENKEKNQTSLSLEKAQNSQRVMISQLIGIFKKYARSCFALQQLYASKNFEQAQIQLTKMIKNRKLEMNANFTESKRKGEGFRRALSPQTSFGGLWNIEVKSPKFDQNGSKIAKRNNVPNFLKRMAEKKMNFLDVLNHKRTVTIEQVQKQYLSKEKKDLRRQNREKCSSKSLNKIKSLKEVCSKDRNSNFSGEISKLSFPTSNYTEKTYDFLTQSGSSSNYLIKKRDFHDLKTEKTAATNKTWKFQSFTPKTFKNNCQSSPTYTQNNSNSKLWQGNGGSCLFPVPQNIKVQSSSASTQQLIDSGLKVPLLAMCNNTSESNYFNETSKEKEPIIEEESLKVSKTLEDEFNDFFSNHSKSPRFMLEALPESNELTEEFSKVIDF